MFDMMKMMGKVKEMQEKMKEVQANLSKITVTADAGAGMVKATVNGKKQVVKVEIDPDLMKPEEAQTVNDLVVAAINKALEEVEIKAKEEMQRSAEGILPNIPGLDLSSMFNG